MKGEFSFNLNVNIFKQGKSFVAYSPALDLSTQGRNEKDVKKKFGEVVRIFFDELIEAGTLDEVLRELGWKKSQKVWNPPQIRSATIDVRVPAFA